MPEEENKEPEQKGFYHDQIEGAQKNINLQKKLREEMESSESIRNYLKDFQPASVKRFIDHYLLYKAMWINHGEYYTRYNEEEQLQWETEASEHLEYIQQKKLFDIQCLWRAEKITIPEVEVCYDFGMWEDEIFNCPFIDPISKEDIDLYMQYLQQNNVDLSELSFYRSWQNYEEMKEAYNDDGDALWNFPEWYDFCNGRRGTGTLMLLPDIRGEKEEFYRNIYRKSIKEEMAAKQAAFDAARDKRPSLNYYEDNFMEWFVTTFDSKEVQEFYRSYTWANRNRDRKEQIETTINLLLSAEEHVPIDAHYNWMEALEIAANKYRVKKIAEALPSAYERYLINIAAGIRFADAGNSRREYRDPMIDTIIKGRILNGEPGDLNF